MAHSEFLTLVELTITDLLSVWYIFGPIYVILHLSLSRNKSVRSKYLFKVLWRRRFLFANCVCLKLYLWIGNSARVFTFLYSLVRSRYEFGPFGRFGLGFILDMSLFQVDSVGSCLHECVPFTFTVYKFLQSYKKTYQILCAWFTFRMECSSEALVLVHSRYEFVPFTFRTLHFVKRIIKKRRYIQILFS